MAATLPDLADDDAYCISGKDAGRLLRMLLWFEARPRFDAPEPAGNTPANRYRLAKATGSITSRATTVPGHGFITLYTFNGTNMVELVGEDYTAWNITGGSSPIAPGTWLLVGRCDGLWFIFAADCSGAA